MTSHPVWVSLLLGSQQSGWRKNLPKTELSQTLTKQDLTFKMSKNYPFYFFYHLIIKLLF